MGSLQAGRTYPLEVRRIFPYPRVRVFQAWTHPLLLKQWFRPGAQLTTPQVEVDLRVGGRYRITMQHRDGQTYTVGGIYQTIEPPKKLAFTWLWEGEAAELETLVTIEFIEHAANETEVILSHRGFAQERTRQQHEEGWQNTLTQLTELPLA